MKGIIGKKLGMTNLFDEKGNSLACTVIEAEPNRVTQVKTMEVDGYNAIQLGYGVRKEKNTPAALKGHFKKSGSEPLMHVVEIRNFDSPKQAGDTIDVNIFSVGEKVQVVGTSKGKGFQGVVKRHGFSGVGMASHGQHNRLRAPGSSGAGSDPSRVFKGIRMSGRMGGDRVKLKNLKVLKVLPEKNLIIVKGAVPGHNGSIVLIEK